SLCTSISIHGRLTSESKGGGDRHRHTSGAFPKNRQQKETAALKIKAAVSNGHENMSALRRLFFFCRRPAD
ncbi:hypothetical protein L0P54_12685, partial [Anaerosalibacter bizertensis]|nr:hypothetical protein [Anaerosalibacter bizertensis]